MLTVLAHPANAILMIALPIGLGVYLDRKFKLGWRLWWIGAATFVLSQIGHIPFNAGVTTLFERGILPAPSASWRLVFNATFLGLSAGLWEELMRYVVYRWWAKDARSWRRGILLGAGHGGMEAILFGTLALVNFFYIYAIRDTNLAQLVPQDQLATAQRAIAEYWGAPWYAVLVGALERAFTLPVQISLSVLVLQTFMRKQARWLFLAIGWHALIDGAAVFAMLTWGTYPTEVVVAASSLISLALIFVFRSHDIQEDQEGPAPIQLIVTPRKIEIKSIETPDKLDQTRYSR